MLAPANAAARKPTNVTPIWIVARKRPGLRHEPLDPAGAAVALVDELLEARAADADERELGGDEQRR